MRRLVHVLIVLSISIPSLTQSARHLTRSELHSRRQQWFRQQRATPQGYFPSGLRWKALQQLDQMMQAEESLQLAGIAIIPATPWRPIGPSSTSGFWGKATGRVFSLLVDPRNSSVVYAGTHGGGVWKSRDGGSTWVPLTDKQPSLGAESLAFDPSDADTIYVGTGVDYGAGILKSTDGGVTWTSYPGPFVGPFGSDSFFGGSARILSIAVSPANPSTVLVADFVWPESNAGVYRSTDGGKTWEQKLGGTPGHTVVFDPSNGNIAYAALCGGYGPPYGGFNAGIYMSSDAGQSWTLVTGNDPNTLPAASVIGDCQILVQPSDPSILFVTVKFTDGTRGLFKSTDAGQNWKRLPDPPEIDILYSSPADPNVLFAGGIDLHRSLDGGQVWTNISSGANGIVLHPDQHSYAFSADSSKLYVGNDGGISSTTSISASMVNWTNLNSGLADELFYPGIAINAANKNIAFGGSQDNGMQRYSGTLAWNEVECGDGGFAAVDRTNSNNVYIACIYADIKRSTTGGFSFGSFTEANTGIDTSDRAGFIAPLIMDPTNSQRLYFGTYRVYQTTDSAASWTAISPDLTSGGVLTTIAVAATNANVVYAGSNNSNISVSTNALMGAAATWASRNAALPPRYITQIAVDPRNSQTAYVVFSGFSGFGDTLGHVFKTTNGGSSWKDISGNLPNIPVNSIVVDPVLANTLYIATDVGTFWTRNGGTWSPLMSGLPKAISTFLQLHNPSRTLRVATYGRSLFDAHLPMADLALAMMESPSPIPHGTNFSYTIRVTNKGPDPARNATITDTVPTGTTFVSVVPSVGTCTYPAVGGTGIVSCKAGSLLKGASATVTLILHDTAAAGSTVTDTAKASSSTPDPRLNNNFSTLKTAVN
jgi:uncharacterized repeat protein (TIGR01451 family)